VVVTASAFTAAHVLYHARHGRKYELHLPADKIGYGGCIAFVRHVNRGCFGHLHKEFGSKVRGAADA